MNGNVRKLTDGAMMTAIVGVVLVINRQTAGMLVSMLLFIFPLPMVFFAAKYGAKDAWAVFVAIVFLSFMLGSLQTMILVASESLIGMMYGGGIYKHTDSRKLIIRTMVMAAVVDLLSMLVFAEFFGYDIVAEMAEYKQIITDAFAETGQVISGTIDLDSLLMTVMVVSTIITGILEGYITHVLARLMLRRLRFRVDRPTPLYEYYPPKWSGYLAIAGMLAYYYAVYNPFANGILNSIIEGFGMAAVMYLAFFGMIAVALYGRVRFSSMKWMFVVLGVLLIFIVSPLLALGGFLYITTDFHRNLLKGDNHA